jgi:hypothetical protein
MKTFEDKYVLWPWSDCSVAVTWDRNKCWTMDHEREIKPGWPQGLQDECRKVIQANRELEEDETRASCGIIKMARVEGGYIVSSDGMLLRPDRPERLAFYEKHRPKPVESLTASEHETIYQEEANRVADDGAGYGIRHRSGLAAVAEADRKREAEIRVSEQADELEPLLDKADRLGCDVSFCDTSDPWHNVSILLRVLLKKLELPTS